MVGSDLSDAEKARIASEFLLQSPPGEFNEVFNDLRCIFNNDILLEKGCAEAVTKYNKSQFIPVKIEGAETPTLITAFNELPDGRFFDPKTRKTFKYDHLRKEATEVQTASADLVDEKLESWRAALQTEVDGYIHEHFRAGVATVFPAKDHMTLCVESHQFQPKNYWNGRWRSEWRLPLFDGTSGAHSVTGTVRLHVHYYEDGNVQLISNKESKLDVKFTNDINATAKAIIEAICDSESAYQNAIQESYLTMSENTFKALRRQLPVTRTKLDWVKLHSFRLAHDMKPQ